MARVRDLDPARVEQRVSDLEDAVLATARPVTFTLAAGSNAIPHGLGRARGRILVRVSAAVTLFDEESADPSVWRVNSSGPATATFIFF